MGVLCSKALELGKKRKENERNTGFPVDRRQTTKKTASRRAHRHSLMGSLQPQPAGPPLCREDEKGVFS